MENLTIKILIIIDIFIVFMINYNYEVINIKKINTILFDLDGTLVDSNSIIIDSFKYVINNYFGISVTKDKDLLSFIGPPLAVSFEKYTNSKEKINEAIRLYRKKYLEIEKITMKLYPNVLEVLKILKERKYNLAIVTTKLKIAAMPSFTKLQINKYIPLLITADDVKNVKPNAEPVLKALSYFNSYKEVVMVGDNQSDIFSGKNASVLTCGVSWALKGKKYIEDTNPTFIIDDMYDLIKQIDKYNEGV